MKNDDEARERRKYRLTIAVSAFALAVSLAVFDLAYNQHIRNLNAGDKAGEKMQMLALDPDTEPTR